MKETPRRRITVTSSLTLSMNPSKPLMSSGSWLTPQNCEIFYLSVVNYHPATTDLIFIRVNMCPCRTRGVGLIANFLTCLIYHGHYLCPAALSHNIRRGHYLPCKINCPVLDCIKAIFHIMFFSFCHDIANIYVKELLCKFSYFSQ